MFRKQKPGTLPTNRLVTGDRPASGLPACKACGAELELFVNPCPFCGAPNPLVTRASVVAVVAMLLGEAAVVWLIFRACSR